MSKFHNNCSWLIQEELNYNITELDKEYTNLHKCPMKKTAIYLTRLSMQFKKNEVYIFYIGVEEHVLFTTFYYIIHNYTYIRNHYQLSTRI